MVTLMDCINRIPETVESIVAHRKERILPVINYLGDKLAEVNEIVFIGSGTSNTSSVTSCRFVEKASGISSVVIFPNEFLGKVAYNPKALYVFNSQSGTSTLMLECQKIVKDKGYWNIGITENLSDNPLKVAVDVHVDMGCGYEEHGTRTIGYVSTFLTHMLIGMELGLARGYLSQADYDNYLAEVGRVPASHSAIVKKTDAWFEANKRKLLGYGSFAIYGGGANYGVALEGALKILEIAIRHLCVGYEIDDGLHGPSMGFTRDVGIIILSDDDNAYNHKLSMGLASFGKEKFESAHIIGMHTRDEADLSFEPQGGAFKAIEYAAVVQVLSNRLAVDFGITPKPMSEWVHTGPSYFNTHLDEE